MAEQRDLAEYTITIEEAAKYLGMAVQTFKNGHAHNFEKVKVGGSARVLFHPDDLLKYKASLKARRLVPPGLKADRTKVAQTV